MTGDYGAAVALAEVKGAQRRSAELRGYAYAGQHLIAWGLVWLIGNTVMQFAPEGAKWVWPVGIACAVIFQMVGVRWQTRANGGDSRRVLATVAAVLGFCAAAMALLAVPNELASAFISLVVAAAYVGLGIWTGARFAWLGLLLAAIVLGARFLAPEWLPLALGVGGGGSLIVAGLWLRRA